MDWFSNFRIKQTQIHTQYGTDKLRHELMMTKIIKYNFIADYQPTGDGIVPDYFTMLMIKEALLIKEITNEKREHPLFRV